jgi:hypothetical protein
MLPRTVNVNLDRDYDSIKSRELIAALGSTAEIARKGVPAPIRASRRWPVERTHSWMNGYGKLRRCTERNGRVVDLYLYLAATLVTLRMLIWQARSRYRWTADHQSPPQVIHLPVGLGDAPGVQALHRVRAASGQKNAWSHPDQGDGVHGPRGVSERKLGVVDRSWFRFGCDRFA